jgi:ABC-type uncharacterized transport system substrate-binding protein
MKNRFNKGRWAAVIFFLAVLSHAQELSPQIQLVQKLMPDATRLGLIYNPNSNINNAIQTATRETGMRIITAEVQSIRDMAKAVRSLDRYDVDFIILVEERVTSGATAVKFVVKQAVKKKTPVYTTADVALSAGALGQFIQVQGKWKVRINGKVLNRFDIQLPESEDFIIEE